MKTLIILSSVLLLSGCFDNSDAQAKTKESVQVGQATFEKNCATCHGVGAQGKTKDWRQRLPNGKFPAPPLNGSAHAWHHSPKALLLTINNGGIAHGGWMPAFKDQLSEKEKQAVLDYIYSLWPKSIQQKYDEKFK